MKTLYTLLAILLINTACSSLPKGEADYPVDPDDRRRAERGKLTGDGLVLFGGSKGRDKGIFGGSSNESGSGIGVNSLLWRAALDTISFVPLASADPFGGVIITDWYEDPSLKNERFKMNILILGKELRADALRVSVFKQARHGNQWKDAASSANVATDLEDKILIRARELRIKQTTR